MSKYLIKFLDVSDSIVTSDSFKDAIINAAIRDGITSDLFKKSLNGFEETDVSGIVRLFNMFASFPIQKIYAIEGVIYDEDEFSE